MTIIEHARPRLARTTTPALLSALGRYEFAGYASLFHAIDGAGDIVVPGAFTNTLRRRPPARVRLLHQHFAHEPIGVWDEIREDAKGLYVRGRLVEEVQRGRETAALLAAGAIDGLSIGFRPVRWRRDGATRRLLEIDLWEISVVTFPLLPGSEVTGIGTKQNAFAQQLRKASALMRTNHRVPSSPAMAGEGDREAVEGVRSDSVRTIAPVRPLRLAREVRAIHLPRNHGGGNQRNKEN